MASDDTTERPTSEQAAPAGDDITATEPAPRKRAARKTAKTATTAKTAKTTKAAKAAETAEKPAKKTTTRRKSAAKKQASAAVASEAPAAPEESGIEQAALSAPSVEPDPMSDPVVLAARGAQAQSVPASSADADDSDDAENNDEAERPVVPSFGLLFQPPAPAPQTPSRPARDENPPQGTDDDGDDSDESDVDDSADSGDDSDRDEESGSRRSRGRSGRRRRSRRDDDANDSSEADDDRSGPSATSSEDAQDSGDADDAAGSDDDDDESGRGRRRRRRGGKGRRRGESDDSSADSDESGDDNGDDDSDDANDTNDSDSSSSRRRRRRRRSGGSTDGDDPPGTVTKVREPRAKDSRDSKDSATAIKGSTRLEAKRQRRREGREAGRRRTIITEAEFLARRESVERVMVVRERGDHTQIGVLEDGVLVEHYISGGGTAQGAAGAPGASMAGNVYLGRVQNVLPSMEAAFVDIGKGRNAVLYAGEVNWDAAGLEQHKSRRIENALSSGQSVLVQVTKDPIGHKGARLTSQVSLPGRYLVYVPDGSMTGISRKLPDTERARLKKILKDVVPDDAGVIVRTAAEGASEEELTADVARLRKAWDKIQSKAKSGNAPVLLHGEPDLTTRVVRDVFNEDFTKLVVAGPRAWETISDYVDSVAPDLADRLERWTGERDVFAHYRVDEQIAKAMDRKVWLPSGGSLVIDRTEAMTVVDVNTGKFTGSGGNLEETVTKNNIEAAEEIVRQLRLRDIGGIIVIDFIDMVLESNRELVVRRLLECLGRDRTKHQVAEVTSLGLVQMTRKRVGAGLIEVFSESCEHCNGRGVIVSTEPLDASKNSGGNDDSGRGRGRGRGSRGGKNSGGDGGQNNGNGNDGNAKDTPSGPTPAQIAAAAYAAAVQSHENDKDDAVEGDAPMESATAEALVEEHLSGESRDVPTSSEVAAGEDESPTGRVSGRVSGRVGGRRAATSEPTTPAGQTSPEGATEPASVEAPPAEEAPAPKRRRAGRRAASAPTAAPTGAEAAVFTVAETEPTEPSTPITMSAADAATDAAATQTPEPPKRRRAARRAAGSPAGPPRATD